MIDRNNSFINGVRSGLYSLGLGKFGRDGLAFIETVCYGTQHSVNVGGARGQFSIKDRVARSYFASARGRGNRRHHLEMFVLENTLQSLQPGMCFYDVGAFLGLYSILAAHKVGASGTVHAFELNEENFMQLLGNVRLNRLSNVQAHLCAVQEQTCVVQFERYSSRSDSTHSLIDLRTKSGQRAPHQTQLAVAITLDDYSRISQRLPDVVKIDVEGAELRVLKGATQTLRQARLVLCELHPAALRADNHSPQEVMGLLVDMGFDLWMVQEFRETSGQKLVEINPSTPILQNCMVIAKRS